MWEDVQPGWMDQEREADAITDAERHAMDLALAAYRRTNAKTKRELLKLLKGFGEAPSP